ncbi:MAG: polysaccharide biosynthesis protein [Phycisphaerales bacterium]
MIPDTTTPTLTTLWTSPVLIGTPETLAALAGQLAVTNQLPAHVGCVLAESNYHDADLAGLPVLGSLDSLNELHAHRPFSVAIVSLPSSQRALIQRVRESLRSLGIPERFVPTLADTLRRPAPANNPNSFAVAPNSGASQLNMGELIGRTPYGIDRKLVRSAIEAKRILITGAGGSIGSEICRIVATFRPSLLVMMERSENALFEIDRQIARRFPEIPRRALLNDVADVEQTKHHVSQIRPHAVFHAAAHKHVPLMEDHPSLAITNNLLGTKSIADASVASGAERFVMISTDKAVNPSSTMGATKRLAEMYVQWLGTQRGASPQAAGEQAKSSWLSSITNPTSAATNHHRHNTQCSIVRFGNVLGSACSVLPIWSQQLTEGGPLTVTDPRMTRYFMTIPEAASLVIQSGSINTPANSTPTVYVLDMGDPIRILELAQRFATLHGYQPHIKTMANTQTLAQAWQDLAQSPEDSDLPTIDIALTGARPGEKLHEELAYAAEDLSQTPYPGVLALKSDKSPQVSVEAMIADLTSVAKTCGTTQDAGIARAAIRRYLPGFAEGSSQPVRDQTTKSVA